MRERYCFEGHPLFVILYVPSNPFPWEELYAVRAAKVFPLVPAIFRVKPIHRSRLRTLLAPGNENV